jgi:hypothetical protein
LGLAELEPRLVADRGGGVASPTRPALGALRGMTAAMGSAAEELAARRARGPGGGGGARPRRSCTSSAGGGGERAGMTAVMVAAVELVVAHEELALVATLVLAEMVLRYIGNCTGEPPAADDARGRHRQAPGRESSTPEDRSCAREPPYALPRTVMKR